MPDQSAHRVDTLSPISRRAFFRRMGRSAVRLGILGAAAGSAGQRCDRPLPIDIDDPDGYSDFGYPDNCGYCDTTGRDYEHCDGDYCDYINYADTGGYSDFSDYGDYSDYSNYSDYSDYSNYSDYSDYSDYGDNCGYCNGPGSDYSHCDGDYCDYTNYADYSDYSDYSDYGDNCGYCNGCGQDYSHCDGDFCTYTNYADGC